MKIDYDRIKEFLITFENYESPIINTIQLFEQLGYNSDYEKEFEIVWHYLKILNEQKLIECLNDKNNNLGISFTGNGQNVISVKQFRLTIIGHQTLETMKSNKLFENLKAKLNIMEVESLKQIPSLAIQLINNL